MIKGSQSVQAEYQMNINRHDEGHIGASDAHQAMCHHTTATMSALLCCNGLQPYRAIRTEHDSKFTRFMAWAAYPQESAPPQGEITLDEDTYVIQMVRQVNFGPVEAKRYLAPGPSSNNFIEVQERDLINANFSKVNS